MLVLVAAYLETEMKKNGKDMWHVRQERMNWGIIVT